MTRAILIHAADGGDIASRVEHLLSGDPITVQLIADPTQPVEDGVDPWEAVVVLLVITSGLLATPDIAARIAKVVGKGLPLVPVVDDLTTFPFATLEHSLPDAYTRNAAGLEPHGGADLLQSVRGHLGLESFSRDKKVFISYRRSDGESVANALYDYLWREKFETFLDRFQLEAGAVVQEQIMEAVAKMDFVLLLDSPDAASSPWVEAEIIEALNRRIPICRVCLDQQMHVPICLEAPRVDWASRDPKRLDKVKRLVSRGIAARQSHEQRVSRSLSFSADVLAFRIETLARRQYRLVTPTAAILVEAEQAPVSIERLHRLYRSYVQHGPAEAILVSGETVLPRTTRDAIEWARGIHPLHVVPLVQLHTLLKAVFR